MFGLFVRFTCKDEAAAEAYDKLVAETIEAIKANEPGTLVYASHTVEGQPLQRIFYELYRDRAAFEAHEAALHTRRYLEARDQYLASTEVDWLTLQAGQGTGGGPARTTRRRWAARSLPSGAAEVYPSRSWPGWWTGRWPGSPRSSAGCARSTGCRC